jgi:hypothetical protein
MGFWKSLLVYIAVIVVSWSMEEDKQVEILFRSYSDILEQEVAETIWADEVDAGLGYFKLYSIPLYTSHIATDDIVYAEWDDDEVMLTYRETVKPSGNSTVWVVVVDDDTDIDEIRKVFFELDCFSEALSNRYFAMEVKAETSYLHVKDKLNTLKAEKLIDYAEPCLSQKHQY